MKVFKVWTGVTKEEDAAPVVEACLRAAASAFLGREYNSLTLAGKERLLPRFEFHLAKGKQPAHVDIAFAGKGIPGGKSPVWSVNGAGTLVLPSAAVLGKAQSDPAYPEYGRTLDRMQFVLEGLLGEKQHHVTSTKTYVVTTLAMLDRVLAKARQTGVFVFDFETKPEAAGLSRSAIKEAALDHMRSLPTVIGLCFKSGEGWAIPLYHFDSPFDINRPSTDYAGNPVEGAFQAEWEENKAWAVENNITDMVREVVMARIVELMRDRQVVKSGHNVKFDLRVASRFGLRTNAVDDIGRVDDTLIMHQLLDETVSAGLKEITAGIWPEYAGYGEDIDYANEPMETLAPYCVADCDLSFRLRLLLLARLQREDPRSYALYRNYEVPKVKMLASMEIGGMHVDSEALQEALSLAGRLHDELSEVLSGTPEVKSFCERETRMRQEAKLGELEAKLAKFNEDKRVSLDAQVTKAKTQKTADNLLLKRSLLDNPLSEGYPYVQGRRIALDIEKLRNEPDPYVLEASSPTQLGEFIYGKHGLNYPVPIVMRQITDPQTGLKVNVREAHKSTDKDELSKLEPRHPVLDTIIDLRLVDQLRNTFLKGIADRRDRGGKVHSSFATIRSRRLSSSNPNLQNIPSRTQSKAVGPLVEMVKRMFTAPNGHVFFQADLSQAELRWIAYMWEVRSMKRMYALKQDLHIMASIETEGITLEQYNNLDKKKAKDLRQNGKAVNFGYSYGAQAETYREYARVTYGISLTKRQAEHARDAFFTLHPDILIGHETYKAKGRKYGYVRTKFGGRRHLPKIRSTNRSASSSDERVAINSPIQGSSAEGMLFALIVFRWRQLLSGLQGFVSNSVHDSALGHTPEQDAPQFLNLLQGTMQNPPTKGWFGFDFADIGMEVDVETGENWKDLSKFVV